MKQLHAPALHSIRASILVYVCAVVMSGAALLLAGSHSFGIWPLADAKRYLPVALHLFANAYLLVQAAQLLPEVARGFSSRGAAIGAVSFLLLPLFSLSMVDVILAGNVILQFDVDTLWVALFAGPAWAGFWFFGLWTARNDAVEKHADGENQPRSRLRFLGLTPEAGRPSPIATLWAYTKVGLFSALYVGALTLFMGIGASYWRLLHDALFEGGGADLFTWFEKFPDLLNAIAPYLIAAPCVLLLSYFVIGATKALYEAGLVRSGARVRRDLGPAETSYAERFVAALADYLASKMYPRAYSYVYWLGSIALIAAIGGTWYGLFQLLPGFWDTLKSARTEGLDWFVYRGGAPTVSLLIAVFLSIFLVWAAGQASVFAIPEFAEYMHAKQGWNSMEPRERQPFEYLSTILRLLRTGQLAPEGQFDPSKLIRAAFREYEAAVFGATGFLALAFGWFLHLDISSYELFTERQAIYTDYWSSKRFEIGYEQIQRVEIECWVNNKNEINLGYEIYFDSNHSVDLLSADDLPEELGTLERLDLRLRNAGVKFVHGNKGGWSKHDEPAFEASCLERLERDFGKTEFQRISKLLHAGDAE